MSQFLVLESCLGLPRHFPHHLGTSFVDAKVGMVLVKDSEAPVLAKIARTSLAPTDTTVTLALASADIKVGMVQVEGNEPQHWRQQLKLY